MSERSRRARRTLERSALLLLALPLVFEYSRLAKAAEGDEWTMPVLKAAFPHDVHVVDNEMECGACHAEPARPEQEVGASSAEGCSECHEPQDVGMYFPAGSHHGTDFLDQHGLEGRTGTENCASCHQGSESCVLCHQAENLDFLAHPRNWIFQHAMDARHQQSDCAVCHPSEQFCADCHASEQVIPTAHLMGGWTRGFVHGSEARRDPTYCATCHPGSEPVCVECHTAP